MPLTFDEVIAQAKIALDTKLKKLTQQKEEKANTPHPREEGKKRAIVILTFDIESAQYDRSLLNNDNFLQQLRLQLISSSSPGVEKNMAEILAEIKSLGKIFNEKSVSVMPNADKENASPNLPPNDNNEVDLRCAEELQNIYISRPSILGKRKEREASNSEETENKTSEASSLAQQSFFWLRSPAPRIQPSTSLENRRLTDFPIHPIVSDEEIVRDDKRVKWINDQIDPGTQHELNRLTQTSSSQTHVPRCITPIIGR